MIMDYRVFAEELVDLQTLQHLTPVTRKLSVLDNGTYLALHYLVSHQKVAHPKELSQNMSISTARVAALLKHMEQEGFIVRTPDPSDNRQIIVSLTGHGEQLIENKRAEAVDIMAEVLEELGPEETKTYLRIQRKLLEKFLHRL